MSDEPTIRIGPDGPDDLGDRDRRRRNVVIGTTVAVVLAAVVLGLFILGGGDAEEDAGPLPTATATAPSTSAPSDPAPVPTSEPAPSPTAEPTPPASEPPAEPATSDVTEFIDAYEAEHGDGALTRLIDADGDGVTDIVAARAADDSAQLDVAEWDGQDYVVVFSDTGGAADGLDDLLVRDVNGEVAAEIVTFQSIGDQGASLSIWGVDADGEYVRQNARGGCWDGANTFGIVGADIETGRIEATCDGSPLPPSAWPSDVYEWDGAWTYVETVETE